MTEPHTPQPTSPPEEARPDYATVWRELLAADPDENVADFRDRLAAIFGPPENER